MLGCWGGQGASRLGLDGMLDLRCFWRLCDNLHPRTRHRVTVRMKRKRTIGYTFRFSPSKSVSLLYGLTGDRAILDAFLGAVRESMCEVEGELTTRVRRRGQDRVRTTGNMVWAEFIHTTSWPVQECCDPQLHAYVFVLNMTWDEKEDRWKAGSFQNIKENAPYFQAAFRVRLANKLQEMGFGVERHGDDFEIAGLPGELLKRFSRRTEVIERVARERGITNPKWKAELGRKTKERRAVWSVPALLRKQWKKRLTPNERLVLASVHRRELACTRPGNGEASAVDHAIEHCFVGEAVVPERKLVTEALKRGIGAVTVEDVTREVANRPLIRSDVAGRKMVTLAVGIPTA